MLNRQTAVKSRPRGELDPVFYEPEYIRYADISNFFRRYIFTILSCISVGLILAAIYVSSATPLYTARAQMLIDPSTTEFIQDKRTELTLDAAKIESQIALLRSDSIVGAVVNQLDLSKDPEFLAASKSIVSQLFSIFTSSPEPEGPKSSNYAQTRIAVENLRTILDVRRAGLAYAINIFITTTEPVKSARIANAIAAAYEQDQILARTKAARLWSEWLEQRIHRLRGQLDKSARELLSLKSGRGYTPNPAEAGTNSEPPSVAVLDATVEAYRNIYASYFQALTNAVEKETSPGGNARVITSATPPLGKSHPRSKLIIAFGLFAGLLSGIGVALLRLSMDTSVRTPKQIKNEIGLDCIARIPRIPRSLSPNAPFSYWNTSAEQRRAMYNYVTGAPFSQFAGAVTALKTGIVKSGRQEGIRSVGVTSALPGEGKSTLSANLATAFTLSSYNVLLIDSDIHNSVISETFAPGATKGLFELLKGEAELKDCIVSGKGAMPDVLPVVSDKSVPISYKWLSSESMLTTLKYLKERYHFIVVDMPPLTPIADGLMIGSLLDGVVLAAEWGKTPRDLLADVTYGLNLADANILGVVLTKVAESAVNLRMKKNWKYY